MRFAIKLMTLVALFSASGAFAYDGDGQVEIEDISMRLFYESSGELSEDITAIDDFAGWNTVIGEGSAREPADNMLVTVVLKTTRHDYIDDQPLFVWAQSGDATIFKSAQASYLTGYDGYVRLPFWLTDIGCAGKLEFTARIGEQIKTETLELHCGE